MIQHSIDSLSINRKTQQIKRSKIYVFWNSFVNFKFPIHRQTGQLAKLHLNEGYREILKMSSLHSFVSFFSGIVRKN